MVTRDDQLFVCPAPARLPHYNDDRHVCTLIDNNTRIIRRCAGCGQALTDLGVERWGWYIIEEEPI